jgi:hypothetical protein
MSANDGQLGWQAKVRSLVYRGASADLTSDMYAIDERLWDHLAPIRFDWGG